MSKIDLDFLRTWVGRERTSTDALALFPAKALSAALDHDGIPAAGDPLPPAWQWLYFLDTPRASATGADGHPSLGGFLPPVPLPRRMWASGSMEIVQPLCVEHPAVRTSSIKSVDAKVGKTGSLIFITLEHHLSQQGKLCIREEQNLVYREQQARQAPPNAGEPAPTDAEWTCTVRPDPVLLFRYSALTYNGHRIHYDRPYAINQEFYPDLVVQGPLLATLLLDLLHKNLPDAGVAYFQFRALKPTLDSMPFSLNGKRSGDIVSLWVADSAGALCMSANARLI